MSIFTPDLYLHHITEIDEALLKKHGIKGIVLDVDNTLTMHGSQEVKQEIIDWLKQMQDAGIKLTIASNNNDRRIKPFAKKIGLDYIAMSCKPLTFAFTKACKTFGLQKHEIAVVGDQIYTDIVGGNLKGMFSILVDPHELENGAFFRFKRRFEKMHIDKYYRRNSKA